jgi:hypothetical protein
MKIWTFLVLALLSPAGAVLAQAPAAPSRSSVQQFDPAGRYEVSFAGREEAGIAVLTISGTAGQLAGSLEVHGHSIPLSVTVQGRSVALRDTTDLAITLTFAEGGAVSGSWTGHGDSGTFTAVRRRE